MPEAEYTTTTAVPVERVWEFVREMDHWAPLLPGYQSHERQGERDSIWTVKGDTGALARVVRFQVQITDWSGPERVVFTLRGLNELMEGDGSFELAAAGAGDGGSAEGQGEAAPAAAPGRPPRLLARALEALARLLLRLRPAGARRRPAATAGPRGSRLRFRLRVEAGGPMGPMVNALMKPALPSVAEELASRILERIEAG